MWQKYPCTSGAQALKDDWRTFALPDNERSWPSEFELSGNVVTPSFKVPFSSFHRFLGVTAASRYKQPPLPVYG
jgi:hypothetical protein